MRSKSQEYVYLLSRRNLSLEFNKSYGSTKILCLQQVTLVCLPNVTLLRLLHVTVTRFLHGCQLLHSCRKMSVPEF